MRRFVVFYFTQLQVYNTMQKVLRFNTTIVRRNSIQDEEILGRADGRGSNGESSLSKRIVIYHQQRIIYQLHYLPSMSRQWRKNKSIFRRSTEQTNRLEAFSCWKEGGAREMGRIHTTSLVIKVYSRKVKKIRNTI